MDYQEAIKEAEAQINMYEAFILYNKDFEPKNDNSNYEFKMDFLKTAVSAMQELQMYKDNKLCLIPEDVYKKQCEELDEYKEIGTVKGYEGAIKAYNDCYFEKQELELELYKYKQLGDFVEVKKAVEKQNMKMPDNLENVTDFTGKLLFKTGNCPECGFENIYSHRTQYCPKCGQKILWKEANEYDS